jgi:hypothetical protein
MRKKILCKYTLVLLVIVGAVAHGQNVSFNSTGTAPNSSAVLDLSGCTNGGFLIPYVTTPNITAGGTLQPTNPLPNSLLVYNTTNNCFYAYYTGSSSWVNVYCPCSGIPTTPTTPSGSASITENSTGNTYTTSSTGATSFTWTVPASVGTITTGQGTATITVTAASSPGSGNITVTATNSCGTTVSSAGLTVTVPNPCSGTISLDNISFPGIQTSSFTITTAHANEVVLVLMNGDSWGGYAGTGVSVTGGSASAVSNVMTNSYGSSFYTCEVVYGFIAYTAATYTLTVDETGYNYNYTSSAVALYGFCNTPTIAANVLDITPTMAGGTGFTTYSTGTHVSSISNSIAPTVANSYIVANYYNWDWYNANGTVAWTAPAGITTLQSTYHNATAGSYFDCGIAGYADAGTGSVTFTLTDYTGGGSKNIYAPILECIEVHN